MKYNFSFTLPVQKALEYLYEFIISHSEYYFGVPNCRAFYSVNMSFENFEMTVSFDPEDSEGAIHRKIKRDEFDGINCSLKSLYDDINNNIITINRVEMLSPNLESRYINYSQSQVKKEIAKMLYYLVNRAIKRHYHDATIHFDIEHKVITYYGCFKSHFAFKVATPKVQNELEKYL